MRILSAPFITTIFFLHGHHLYGAKKFRVRECLPTRTISFSSGYLTGCPNVLFNNSNRALSNFYDEISMAYSLGFDQLSDFNWSRRHRGWFSIFSLLPHSVLVFVQSTGYHEWGHFSRDRAFGYNPYFVNKRNLGAQNGFEDPFRYTLYLFSRPFQREATNRGTRTYLPESAFQGVNDATRQDINAAFNAGGMNDVSTYVNAHDGEASITAFKDNLVDENIIISAAGVNNAMRLSGDIANRIYSYKAHITDFTLYLWTRLQTCSYPSENGANLSNDMDALISGYTLKKIPVTKNNLNLAAQLSFFCSASTYAYLIGWGRFLKKGRSKVKPLEIGGFRLPDVETYFCAQGVSYKIISGYRLTKHVSFPISVEFIGKGEKGSEISLGSHIHIPSADNLEISAYVLFGRALGGGGRLRIHFEDIAFIEGVAETMHYKSYYGQRNIPTLKNSLRSTAFLIRAGVMY